MYTAEPDATGTAYDEINSLIYLDDVQNAPTAPEGSTLAKMAGFLTSIGEYNPVERMLGKETFMQKMGEVPTLLMGLGLLASPQKAATKLEKTVTLYRGVNKWFPGRMVKEGKFFGRQQVGESVDKKVGEIIKKAQDTIYVTPERETAEFYATYSGGVKRMKTPPDAVVLEFEVPVSYLEKHANISHGTYSAPYEYRVKGGLPKRFFRKKHNVGQAGYERVKKKYYGFQPKDPRK
jgi:hypothetical protein